MKTSSLVQALVSVAAGAAAGAVVVTMGSARTPAARATSPAIAVEQTTVPPAAAPAFAPPPRADDAELARRIAELDRRIAALSASSQPAGLPLDRAALEADREAASQRRLEEHAALLAKHATERRDLGWATREEREVTAKLGALSQRMHGSFALDGVDCRTSTCVASLRWADDGAARGDLRELLMGSSNLDCAREIAFPPASGGGPYTASLYVDCTDLREASR